MKPSVSSLPIVRFGQHTFTTTDDLVAAEEPLEIRLGYGPQNDRRQQRISVTMRTPGHDFELALGFLYTEGILKRKDEIVDIRYCTDGGRLEEADNIVRVELAPDAEPELAGSARNFYMTSSCGVCGKSSIESVRTACPVWNTKQEPWIVSPNLLHTLPQTLRERQLVFGFTGGLHACALFNVEGELLMLREDVGRHNALDKLIGAQWTENRLPLQKQILLLSGRASFELIQKAAMAGVEMIASVGAPSSLAVQLAEEHGITLLGFLRDERFNIYTGKNRIAGA